MTREELIELCSTDFYENFAELSADRVMRLGAFDELFELMCEVESLTLPKTTRDKVAFRSAYIAETIYFRDREAFKPYYDRFFELLSRVQNLSARRHYGKMAMDIISRGHTPHNIEDVAVACVDWITSPASKVAVQIWAMEILIALRDRVEWVDDVIRDIFVTLAQNNPTPAITCRLRVWSKRLMYGIDRCL